MMVLVNSCIVRMNVGFGVESVEKKLRESTRISCRVFMLQLCTESQIQCC